jgi:DNA-binding CsgD family transcriptional regulator
MSGPAARRGRSRGRRQQRPGSGSSARRWWPTAIGARPRRSSQPAPSAPRRPCRPRAAHAVAARIGARPLLRELELLAQRARLDLAPPPAAFPEQKHGPEEILGLTPREAQVLNLLARGYTNREIAAALVISVKTVSVHVSHILRKLGAPNRFEAAATISRLAPPPSGQFEPKA